MPPLSRFAVDNHNSALVVALADLKVPIRTAETLLSRDAAQLAKELRLPLHAVDDFRKHVAQQCAPPRLRILSGTPAAAATAACATCPFDSAAALSLAYADLSITLSTGSDALDEVLDGGLRTTEVTEVVGRSGCGKTQLCLTAAVAAALKGHSVVYLDATNGFSARRCLEIARHRAAAADAASTMGSCNVQAATSPGGLHGVMARIRVLPVFDVFGALNSLEHIASSLDRKPHGSSSDGAEALSNDDGTQFSDDDYLAPGPSLVILDSVTALVAPILGGDARPQGGGFAGQALLGHLVASLRRLAVVHAVGVLVTNDAREARGDLHHGGPFSGGTDAGVAQTSGGGSPTIAGVQGNCCHAAATTDTVKPALGASWVYAASVRLALTEGVATVTKHPRRATGATVGVFVGPSGFG